MSNAPTPPPHVPMSLLKAGGSKFFSVQCQKLLIEAYFNPDWVGSYGTVKTDVISPAREGVGVGGRYKNGARSQLTAEDRQNLREATPSERYLARCESVHVIHDAAFREKGQRGDPCANYVDGYLEEGAPAIPMETVSTRCAGTGTRYEGEHRLCGQSERQQLAAATASGTYTEAQRHADERQRLEQYLEEHKRKYPAYCGANAVGPEQPGSMPPDPSFEAKAAAVGHSGDITAPESGVDAVDGQTAAECLDSWKKRAEEEMKGPGLDEEISKLDAATGGANHEERREALQDRVDDAENDQERRQAQAELERHDGNREKLECLSVQRDRIRSGAGRRDAQF